MLPPAPPAAPAAGGVVAPIAHNRFDAPGPARHANARRTTMSISEELGKLGELHQRGVLTDDEFARAKARLIGAHGGFAAPPSGAASSVPFVAGFNALRRSTTDRWIGGVCGGIAPVLGLESWVCRLLMAVLTLFGGFGVIVYLLLWIFVPPQE
jgi:phage shock protein PspC (stress-responsive transcriptional regulator)